MRCSEAWVAMPKDLGAEKLAAMVEAIRDILVEDGAEDERLGDIREILFESGLMATMPVEEFIKMHTAVAN